MKNGFLFAVLLGAQLISLALKPQPADPIGLKDAYKNYFPIGVAVAPRNLTGPEADLILQQFNSLTPENAMKMGPIHPEENRYNWSDADAIVDFAQQHKLKVRGHNLCWHQQYPKWIFTDQEGKTVSKEVLLQRLKDHITTVVSRYKGKVYQWDVVNEAIDDKTQNFLRNSEWYQICGDEFIIKAFEYAHAADPKAELFYNDYNTERPEKRDRVYRLLKQLVDAKVPIHGVGLQGHWSIYEPTEQDLRDAIRKFASLGLKVQITELDISIYPSGGARREKRPDESDAFTPEMQQKQEEQYKTVFRVFRQERKKLTGVTFWNVSDRHSWLTITRCVVAKTIHYYSIPILTPNKRTTKSLRFEPIPADCTYAVNPLPTYELFQSPIADFSCFCCSLRESAVYWQNIHLSHLP